MEAAELELASETQTLSISGPIPLLDAVFADKDVALSSLRLQIYRDEDLETRSAKEKLKTTLIVIGTVADLLAIGSFVADKAHSAPKHSEIVIVGDYNKPQFVVVDPDGAKDDIANSICNAVGEVTRANP